MAASPQIPLPLQPRRPDRFDDFVAGPNQALVDALRNLGAQEGASLFLQGPPASGKSHLLGALCHEMRGRGRAAWYIGLEGLEREAAAGLEGLYGLVCFDDLHAVAGDRGWEEAVFHCFNQVRDAGGQIAVSSRVPLSALDFALPDLSSRLAWGLRLKLLPLGEDERVEVLRHRARSLDMALTREVEQYLLRRIQRDMASLVGTLEDVNRAALAAKRKITVPLVREVMDRD